MILQPNISLQLLREKKENVTRELEILQSSAACSTTSSLDVVSNKVRLLEKNKKKKKKQKPTDFWLLSFPVGIGTAWGGQRARFWEFLVGWGCWKFGVVWGEVLTLLWVTGIHVWEYPG